MERLERAAGLSRSHAPVEKAARLRRLLAEVWGAGEEQVGLITALLDPPPPSGEPGAAMPPPVRLQRTVLALRDTILQRAARLPVLLVVEDVHWIDPTSAEFLRALIDACPQHRLMVVATSRPGAVDLWQAAAAHVRTLRLDRLSDAECAALARGVAANDNLPEATITRIVAKTDGIPLFAEEYASMVLQAAQTRGVPVEEAEVPATLHGLIMDRLDGLPAARPLVQVGAAVGREFPLDLVAALLGLTPGELAGPLDALLEANLVFRSRQPKGAAYMFKHALVQDMAYGSLPRRRRVRIHDAIAAAYQGPFAHLAQGRSELLAYHLRAAERPVEAARCYLEAGAATIRRGAPQEATAHFRDGLEVLAALADEPEVLRLRLELLSALGPTLMVANGPGAAAFGETQGAALDLCRRLGEEARLFPILYGRALHAWGSGDLRQAAADAAELRERALTFGDDEHHLASATMSALVAWHAGEPRASFRHLRGVVRLYRPERHHRLFYTYLMEFGVFGRFYLALSLAVLGRPRAARAAAAAALDLARSLDQPHALGFGRLANFVTATLLGDSAAAAEHADACLPLAREQGFPEFVALALICRGAAKVREGELRGGTGDLEEGVARWRDTGFETWQSWFGALLGGAHLAAGRADEALAEVDRQLRRVELNGERQFEALLLATRSRIRAALGDDDAAARDLSRSRSVAVAQGTRLWLGRNTGDVSPPAARSP
jgi:predicted ATPase